MKTIELMGEPFNVSEEVADAIAAAQQDKKIAETKNEIRSMANAVNPEQEGLVMFVRDSLDIGVDEALGLHLDGVLDIVDFGDEVFFLHPDDADDLMEEGFIVRLDAPRQGKGKQCPGGYWIPKNRNCRKGGAAKAGAKSLDRIAGGGASSKARSARQARIKELRALRSRRAEDREAGLRQGSSTLDVFQRGSRSQYGADLSPDKLRRLKKLRSKGKSKGGVSSEGGRFASGGSVASQFQASKERKKAGARKRKATLAKKRAQRGA